MNPLLPYKELLPGTPEHKAFISNAIMSRNFTHLAALKNRTGKPLHIVSNWFFYGLLKFENLEDVVIIYDEKDQESMQKIFSEE